MTMIVRLDRVHRVLPAILGAITFASVGVLLASDVFPQQFPANAHDIL